MLKIDADRIPSSGWSRDSIHWRNAIAFLLKGSKEFVPDDENLRIISVDVLWINRMVYTVVRWGYNNFFQYPHSADVLRMVPELDKQVKRGDYCNHVCGNTEQCSRN